MRKWIMHLRCPKCDTQFTVNGYWRWVFTSPFHGITTRKTKCPKCGKRSYMEWEKITKW